MFCAILVVLASKYVSPKLLRYNFSPHNPLPVPLIACLRIFSARVTSVMFKLSVKIYELPKWSVINGPIYCCDHCCTFFYLIHVVLLFFLRKIFAAIVYNCSQNEVMRLKSRSLYAIFRAIFFRLAKSIFRVTCTLECSMFA